MSWKDRKITADEMMRIDPFYERDRADEIFADGLTPLEIADLEICAGDILWILTRDGVLPDRPRRLFACWCARDAVGNVKTDDPRQAGIIDVAERFAKEKATSGDLREARAQALTARTAASRAQSAKATRAQAWATWSATLENESNAAWAAAAWAATRHAWAQGKYNRSAWNAARANQVAKLREVIVEMEAES